MSEEWKRKDRGKRQYIETKKTYTDKKGEFSCELVKTDSEKGKKRKRRMADGRKILVEINGL